MSLATRLFLLTLLAALPIFAILIVQEGQLLDHRRDEIIARLPEVDVAHGVAPRRPHGNPGCARDGSDQRRAGIGDEEARQQFDEVAAKVATVARVHQRLYRDENVELLAFGTFLEEMCKDLVTALSGSTLARVHCEAEACRLPTDVAIPLAPIINELVINAAK